MATMSSKRARSEDEDELNCESHKNTIDNLIDAIVEYNHVLPNRD